MIQLKNWDNKTWLSSRDYIRSFNAFLLKKKKLKKTSKILEIGCGRGKIFGSLSRKLKLLNKPVGIDPVSHKDVDKSIDFRNVDVFKFFKANKDKFDLIMIKQTLHFLGKDKQIKLIKICKNKLKKNGVLLILSLKTTNNEIPCFKLMKQKLNRGLVKDIKMFIAICRLLKNYKQDQFKFEVSLTKKKYIKMLKQKYISCLLSLNSNQINEGIKEINISLKKRIIFNDTLESIQYTRNSNLF